MRACISICYFSSCGPRHLRRFTIPGVTRKTRRPNKNRDRDPDCSESPPTPPGVPVRTGRFISLTIYRGVCRERFRCLRATHLRISLGLYDVSVQCLQSFRGSQLWRECVRVAKIQTRCLRITFAGFLPTVRRLPAVALALYFN